MSHFELFFRESDILSLEWTNKVLLQESMMILTAFYL